MYTAAQSSVESMDQELELLRSMPSPPPVLPPPLDPRRQEKSDEDDMWKLDVRVPVGGPDGKGPLHDPQGKVR